MNGEGRGARLGKGSIRGRCKQKGISLPERQRGQHMRILFKKVQQRRERLQMGDAITVGPREHQKKG